MNTERVHFEGYFLEQSDDGVGTVMVLTGPWRDDFRRDIVSHDVSCLRVSEHAGWVGEDVEFVRRLWGLKGLEIYSDSLRDLSPLSRLCGLELLAFDVELSSVLDLSEFQGLRICKLHSVKNVEGLLDHAAIEQLRLDRFPESDLSSLLCPKLRLLQLSNASNLISVAGVEGLTVEDVRLFGCGKLEDLSCLGGAKALRNLEIRSCRKVRDISALSRLSGLERVYLENCGDLVSISSLAGCSSLAELLFIGDMKVLDGDFTPMLKAKSLEKMWYANRRHYSHRREEFNAALRS